MLDLVYSYIKMFMVTRTVAAQTSENMNEPLQTPRPALPVGYSPCHHLLHSMEILQDQKNLRERRDEQVQGDAGLFESLLKMENYLIVHEIK